MCKKSIEKSRQEGIFIALLASHRGRNNPITADEISKYLGEQGFTLKPRSVGNTVRDLKSRINALQDRISHLLKFVDPKKEFPNHECGECSVWLGSDDLTIDQTREMCVARGCNLVGGDNRESE